jgi:hypothetical protein
MEHTDLIAQFITNLLSTLDQAPRELFIKAYVGITSSDYQSQIRGTIPDTTRITAFDAAVESVREAFPDHAPWCTAAQAGKITILPADTLLKSMRNLQIRQNTTPSVQTVKAKKDTPSGKVPLTPTQLDTAALYGALAKIRDSGEPPYSNIASSGNRCTLTNCKTCTEAFTQVNLTPCVGHKPCLPEGYFPHVRAGLLSRVTEAHNKPSRSPKLLVKEPTGNELVCLSIHELRSTKVGTLVPTIETPIVDEESTTDMNCDEEEPSYNALSPNDTSWADECEEETDAQILQAASLAARNALTTNPTGKGHKVAAKRQKLNRLVKH